LPSIWVDPLGPLPPRPIIPISHYE